jgi:hypothetical protein
LETQKIPQVAGTKETEVLQLHIGANVGRGSVSMGMFWGSVGPALAFTRYVNAVTGMEAGTPGGSFALYAGAIAGWM